MSKWCKKCNVTEVYHFTKATFNRDDMPLWLKKAIAVDWENAMIKLWSQYGGNIIAGEIRTAEGTIPISEGDYIIKDENGEFCSYNPKKFSAIYDKVYE